MVELYETAHSNHAKIEIITNWANEVVLCENISEKKFEKYLGHLRE